MASWKTDSQSHVASSHHGSPVRDVSGGQGQGETYNLLNWDRPGDEVREMAIETRWCIMTANGRQRDGDQAWRKWKPSPCKLEANSNVCCHGRGMLQWDPEKLTPKLGTASWRIGGWHRGSRLIRRQGIATLITTGSPPRSPATASPEADKKPKTQRTNLPFRFSKVINGYANAHTDTLHATIFPCLPLPSLAFPWLPSRMIRSSLRTRQPFTHCTQHEAPSQPSSHYSCVLRPVKQAGIRVMS